MKLMRHLPRFRKAHKGLELLKEREGWSREKVESFQLRKVNDLWLYATSNVPYYRNLAKDFRLPPSFDCLEEFQALTPLLSKSVVRSQREEFLSEQPGRGFWWRTGGSTGSPMSVYSSYDAHHETLKAKYRIDDMWGIDIFSRKTFLWGHNASFAPGLPGLIDRIRMPLEDRLRNRLRLSAYRLGQQDLRKYSKQISRFRTASIYGYSTAIYLLAQEAERLNFHCDSLKLCILTGEPALPYMVDTIERAFGVPAVVEYGAIECGLLANEWPDRTFRVREDRVLIETLSRSDGLFDIVVTVLGNSSFPLIRYVIEDVTDAQLQYPYDGFAILGNVGGRRNDMVVSRSGRHVHSQGIKHVLEYCHGVRRFRAHQDQSGHLLVTIEPDEPSTFIDTLEVEKKLKDLLEGSPVTVKVTDVLEDTKSGKHRWVVSDRADQLLREGRIFEFGDVFEGAAESLQN